MAEKIHIIMLSLPLLVAGCGNGGGAAASDAMSTSGSSTASASESSGGPGPTTGSGSDPATSDSVGSMSDSQASTGGTESSGAVNETEGAPTSTTTSPSSTGESTTGMSSTTTTGEGTTGEGTTGEGTTGEGTTGAPACQDVLPNPAGAEAVLAPEYAADYTVYDLGPVPKAGGGVLTRLGGLVVFPDDPLMAYVIGPSEVANSELHVVPLERGPCGHIIGFGGGAVKLLGAPFLDLMSNGPKGVVFISHYPSSLISQLVPGEAALASTIDLKPLGVEGTWSPGGLGFVPPGYPDAGMLRIMGYPLMQDKSLMGSWYRADITYNGTSYTISPVEKTVELPGGPGGFAYIPKGSPGFPDQRIMVTEWLTKPQGVSSYAVDDEGDPIVASRKPFFTSFKAPWGSYFEPETGDYLFLQWEAAPDHVYIVQGFVPPPLLPQ